MPISPYDRAMGHGLRERAVHRIPARSQAFLTAWMARIPKVKLR